MIYVCLGRGFCGRCAVKVIGGLAPARDTERRLFGDEGISAGFRLACVTDVVSDMIVSVSHKGLKETEPVPEDPIPGRSPDSLSVISRGEYVFNAGDSTVFLGKIAGPMLGVAIDAGTTSIDSILVDLMHGPVVGRVRVKNLQERMGADVISRVLLV